MPEGKIIGTSLIQEEPFFHKPKNIRFSKTANGIIRVVFDAILQDFISKNRNNKLYGAEEMQESIDDPNGFIYEALIRRSLVGEAGHPILPKDKREALQRQLGIDHSNISHRINKLKITSDKLLVGEIEATATERGNDFHNLILQDLVPAFSYRGIGPVVQNKDGSIRVTRPMKSRTWDWVFHPSHKDAYKLDNMLSESNINLDLDSMMLSENKIMTLTENHIIDYIKDKDKNLKYLSEALEASYDSIILSENKQNIIVTQGNNRFDMKIGDYVNKQIHGYLTELNVGRFR